MMKPTIHDVARLSGVSIGTVSRVLNNRTGVKPATGEKVRQVVADLGYVPESAARDLSSGNSLTIGIHQKEGTLHLAPFSVLFYQTVMRRMVATGGRAVDLPSRKDGLPHLNVSGIILLGAHKGDPRIDYLEREGMPYVLIGHDLGKSWVAPDDYDGGLQVGRYLATCGHRDILFVASSLLFQNTIDRRQGFTEALAKQGITLPEKNIIAGINTPLEAYRGFMRFNREQKETARRSTAVFACSDEIAGGIIAALTDLGREVPRDVSVVGFDDIPELSERLSTVHQNIPDIAETAIALLRDQIGKGTAGHRILPVQLIVRESSGINLTRT